MSTFATAALDEAGSALIQHSRHGAVVLEHAHLYIVHPRGWRDLHALCERVIHFDRDLQQELLTCDVTKKLL